MAVYACASVTEEDRARALSSILSDYHNGGRFPFKSYDGADKEFLTWFKQGLSKRMVAAGIYPLCDDTFTNFVLLEGSDLDQMRGITEKFSRELGVRIWFHEMTAKKIDREYKSYGGVDGLKRRFPVIASIVPSPDMGKVTLEQIVRMAAEAGSSMRS